MLLFDPSVSLHPPPPMCTSSPSRYLYSSKQTGKKVDKCRWFSGQCRPRPPACQSAPVFSQSRTWLHNRRGRLRCSHARCWYLLFRRRESGFRGWGRGGRESIHASLPSPLPPSLRCLAHGGPSPSLVGQSSLISRPSSPFTCVSSLVVFFCLGHPSSRTYGVHRFIRRVIYRSRSLARFSTWTTSILSSWQMLRRLGSPGSQPTTK